jgi:hypothetical protein
VLSDDPDRFLGGSGFGYHLNPIEILQQGHQAQPDDFVIID